MGKIGIGIGLGIGDEGDKKDRGLGGRLVTSVLYLALFLS